MEKFRYIDLFAGCGGLSLGLHSAGWQGVFAIEKSPDAFKTLKHNLIDKRKHFDWPSWLDPQAHDINEVIKKHNKKLQSLSGSIDLVAGGPPCQGFSTAGKRRENDKRNNLIDSYLEFIKLVQPKVILFENVKGFTLEFKTNRQKGMKYANHVQQSLEKEGYFVKGDLINFAEYGVPQKRTRFILVGIREDVAKGDDKIVTRFFEQLEDNRGSFLQAKGLPFNPTLEDSISDLLKTNGTEDGFEMRGFKSGVYSDPQGAYQRIMRKDYKADRPNSHRFPNHRPHIVSRFEGILKEAERNKDLGKDLKERMQLKKNTIIPLAPDEASPTITTLPDDYIHYCEPRILTVREYARIQSFPDWYEFKGKYTTGGKLRTQEVPRYSQIGNAIPPLFGEQTGLVLRNLISNAEQVRV